MLMKPARQNGKSGKSMDNFLKLMEIIERILQKR